MASTSSTALAATGLIALAVAATPTLTTAQQRLSWLPAPCATGLLLPQDPAIVPLRLDRALPAPRDAVSIDAYVELSPVHQRMVRRLLGEQDRSGTAQACWLSAPTPAAASLLEAAMRGATDFQPGNRWTDTASGNGLSQGDPTTITYSFVPDGTWIPNGIGEGGASSDLFATFNGAFPSQATWQDRIHDAFERWSQLTGITFVHEPNDDGATMNNGNDGAIGVRGDVRIGGKHIDGSNSVLAYNYYPDRGDMVLDTADASYYGNSTNDYRRLFNVVGHEVGHGIGIQHVCPIDQSKLLEPTLSTMFVGPQFDDVLTGQRLYGDAREPNDAPTSAHDLGALPDGLNEFGGLSIDSDTDVDHYRFSVAGDKLLSVTVSPSGTPYLEGPQVNGSCTAGVSFDPRAFLDLAFEVLDAQGTTVLATANAQPAGGDEQVTALPLSAGSYQVRVVGTGVDHIQAYRLSLDIVDNGDVAAANPVGTGCGGLTWNAINRPVLGLGLVLTLDNIPNPGGSIGLFLLGESGLPTGIDLTALGAPGCRVYQTTLDIRVAFPLTNTLHVFTLPIPSNPALSGGRLWTQGALAVPPGTNPLGVLTANGLELVLGTQ